MKQVRKYVFLLVIGGNLYYILEVIWRGYSHFSMFLLGGLCFILIGLINESHATSNLPLIMQQAIAAIIITLLEFVFGLIFNIYLGLGIWDYSSLRFNYMGQICLTFSILWFFLSLPAIMLDDYLRYWIFDEEKPKYRYFGFYRKRV